MRLSQGWFVDQTVANALALTLHLDYLNHAGERWTAWRAGDRFLHVTEGNAKPAFVSEVIEYQDENGAQRTAQIRPPAGTGTGTGPMVTAIISPAPNAAG